MKINLNKNWSICYADIECGHEAYEKILGKISGWIEADVPCDIHEPLIREGIIKEPLDGLNCFDSEWIENKSWWFKKSFQIDVELLREDVVELVLESLDIGADIILNGQLIGRHMSAFYPFLKDVKGVIKEGENQLLIRLTTGLERFAPEETEKYNISTEEDRRPGRGDARRAFLRKPQFSYGWDWGPKVSTCGIVKGVWIESYKKAAIRGVRTFVKSIQPTAKLGFALEIENFDPYSTVDGYAGIDLSIDGKKVAECRRDLLLKSGVNYIDAELEVKNAKLWWPNGMGDQALYTVNIAIDVQGCKSKYPEYQYGIRTIDLDTSELRAGERMFAVTVNGVRTFCKGANWIPADSIYSRVSDEKYEKLLQEAKEANFNMLRVWGGGLYERDIFYEQCDRLGIIIWHDFMFACAEYPDDQEMFLREVEKEVEYQTKNLRNHPAIALWCGNNEIHWAFDGGWEDTRYYGSKIYNYVIPAAVRRNCPDIPYWNSSPYGGVHPNGNEIGDRHHWHDCMMSPDMQKRITPEEYDKVQSKFISEYGYVGPLKRSSIEKFLDGAAFDINGEVWQHHNNAYEKDTVLAGISFHYRDTEKLDIDSYLLYAGLCQGLIYGYSLEAFRFQKECSGALFWMYNDCWGETGWTIIDYYLTRKVSFYFVKRAFAPVKFVLREESGLIRVVGINEGPVSKTVTLEYGYVSFDGVTRNANNTTISLDSHSRGEVLHFHKDFFDVTKGVYYVKAEDNEIPLALLRTGPFRELNISPAKISIEGFERHDSKISITVRTGVFAHAVHFKLQDEIVLSDEYFDMLPGQLRRIEIVNVPEDLDVNDIRAFCVNGE